MAMTWHMQRSTSSVLVTMQKEAIGENRRCFSEGYALGYQDALSGRQQYFANYTGDTDLVSLLLSNVIGGAV